MHMVNDAISHECLPVPTVDEALEEMYSSTVFTELDFNMGFRQILLTVDSRDVTTLCMQGGLFQYKRLSFGTKAAPEKFQLVVRQVLTGCEGVTNIADDIVVHGQGHKEHDRHLLAVIQRL